MTLPEPIRLKDDRSQGPDARAAELLRGLRPTPPMSEGAVDGLLHRLHAEALAPPQPGPVAFVRRHWRPLAAAASALLGVNLAFAGVTVYRARVQERETAAQRRRSHVAASQPVPDVPKAVAPVPAVAPLDGAADGTKNPIGLSSSPKASVSKAAPRSIASRATKAPGAVPADSLADEAALVTRGLSGLREGGDVAGALGALQAYLSRYPAGSLRSEAEVGELEGLLRLGRKGEAVSRLDGLAARDFMDVPRADELRVLRGELLAERGRCSEALGSFGAAAVEGPLRERALYGSAVCRAQLGDEAGSRRGFERLLSEFPEGAHAAAARQALR